MQATHYKKWQYPEVPMTSKQSLRCCIQVIPSLFELVYIVERTPSIPILQRNIPYHGHVVGQSLIAQQSTIDSFLFMNTLFHFKLCRADRYVTSTVVTGFILLIVHAQTVTSVLAFRINHQLVVLPSTHPFPCTFQPLNKAVHL